ncbi:MAG: tRNA (adenosine(37)-N6)-threonylcarbamoyltransferase complex ATPase subunit type 1 TsaE [Flavobacteriales bacterium]|nr:tRNA (adenosine(37)-N6)-threonylcarbamoyltransferase complex ATPase subunit type 1 TsaE [Flavobacteriales bacterium]
MEFTLQFVESEVQHVASRLIGDFPKCRIFLFKGDLGSGKTTLIKAIGRELGVEHEMSSPTFGLVNAYRSKAGELYHFDLYRIRDVEEMLDLGIDEYLDSGAFCFLEWPELGQDIFRSYPHVMVRLEQMGDGSRRIFAQG